MFAKIIHQNRKIKKKFYDRITLYSLKNPSDTNEKELKRRKRQGLLGEFIVALKLWLFLPRKSIILNNIVLEVRPNIFTQIDHLVLCPQGIYVIETKTWNGEFNNNIDNEWEFVKKQQAYKIKSDPVAQNKYHIEMLNEWLEENFKDYNKVKDFIYSMIVLNKGDIYKNYGNTRLAKGGFSAAIKINHEVGKNISNDVLNNLANLIKEAKELEHWKWIHEHFNINDNREVIVSGTRDEALKVVQIYKAKGFEVTYLKELDEDQNKWSFKISNHVKYVDEHIEKEARNLLFSKKFISKSFKKAFSPSFVRTITVILLILSLITWNYDKIESKFLSIFDYLNKSVAVMSENLDEASDEDKNMTAFPLMTFKVKDKYSYVMIKDGTHEVMKKMKFRKGSEIVFLNNRRIIISDVETGKTEYIAKNNIIHFEVGNYYTEIFHGDKSIDIRAKVIGYDFENDIIIE